MATAAGAKAFNPGELKALDLDLEQSTMPCAAGRMLWNSHPLVRPEPRTSQIGAEQLVEANISALHASSRCGPGLPAGKPSQRRSIWKGWSQSGA
jgi:hypothetical protein